MRLRLRTPETASCSVRGIGVALSGEHVHAGLELLQAFLLRHAEALLLVDHQQAEIGEAHRLAEQRVRADDDVDRSVGQPRPGCRRLLRGDEARELCHAHRQAAEAFAERGMMLAAQQRRRHHDGGLLARDRRTKAARSATSVLP